jgi:hypothetical protein
MKKLAFRLIVVLSGIVGNAQTKNFIDQPYIDTTAKVDTLVAPDRIFIKIILQESDSKGIIAIEDLEIKMEKSLKKLGVDSAKDLKVSDMSSNFKKYFLKQKDIQKNKTYSLLLHEANTAAHVFIELEKIGISNVYLEKTEYSKIENVKLDLKTKAILKAKNQAEYLCRPLGQKVGKAIYIMDRNMHISNYRNQQHNEGGIVAYGVHENSNPLAINFQKIKLETTVSVKFEME